MSDARNRRFGRDRNFAATPMAPPQSSANSDRFMSMHLESTIKMGYYAYKTIRERTLKEGLLLENRGFASNNLQIALLDGKVVLPEPDVTNIATKKFFSRYTSLSNSKNSLKLYDENSAEKIANRDIIPFYFKDLRTIGGKSNQSIVFRATLKNIDDRVSPQWSSYNYIGNPYKYYTFSDIERSLSFSFVTLPYSDIEFLNFWRKINKLYQMVHPHFKSLDKEGKFKIFEAPIISLRIGDYINEKIGIIDSVDMKILESSLWEANMYNYETKTEDVFDVKSETYIEGLKKEFINYVDNKLDSVLDFKDKKPTKLVKSKDDPQDYVLEINRSPKARTPLAFEISIGFKILNITRADAMSEHFDHVGKTMFMPGGKYDYNKDLNLTLDIENYIERKSRLRLQEKLAHSAISSIGSSRQLKDNLYSTLISGMDPTTFATTNLLWRTGAAIARGINSKQ